MVQVEDITAVAKGLPSIFLQMIRFGPVIASRMTIMTLYSLPHGLAAAGAESVKEAVDHGDNTGQTSQLPLAT